MLDKTKTLSDLWVKGRVPSEGYERGWGLQFGSLTSEIDADPLYQRAREVSLGLSIIEKSRQQNIFLLLTRYFKTLASQNVIEFGAYKGGNVLFMAFVLRELFPNAKVYALDTFEGMPETSSIDKHRKGDFSDNSIDILQDAAKKYSLTNIVILKGLFQDTFTRLAMSNPSFGLAHVDCDIYSAVRYSEQAVWPFLCDDGYIAFDDATTSSCLGATQAVEEMILERHIFSEQVWPHFVFRKKH